MSRSLAAVVVAVALAGGCSWATSTTAPRTVFGYDRPVRIALLAQGPGELIAAWRASLVASELVEIVDEQGIEDEALEDLTTRMCKRAHALAAAGTPVDEVVSIMADRAPTANRRCARTRFAKPFFDRLIEGTAEVECTEYAYVSGVTSASAMLHVVDAATCRLTRRRVLPSPSFTGYPAGVATLQPGEARRIGRSLFPRGLAILGARGRELDVARRGDTELEPGAIFVVRGHAPGKEGTIGRMRVVKVEGERATLEAEQDNLGVGVGDELRAHATGHQWTLYPALLGGSMRDDGGTRGTVGVAAALRWLPHRIPLLAELEVAADTVSGRPISHTSGGAAVGLRWPFGALQPLVLVEAGVATAYQDDVGGRPAIATGGYYGAGAGAELWLRRVFIAADARYRKLSTGEWTTNTEAKRPTMVDYDDRNVTMLVVRLAAGFRF